MDNSMVSARVPQAKKERLNGVLASIGATTSDVINSAIDYVIATRELPRADAPSSKALISGAEGFRAFVEASTLDIEWPADADNDYKSLMRRERLADYESLA